MCCCANYKCVLDEPKPLKDLKSFENEWLEVEVKPPKATPSVPVFLADPLPAEYTAEHESAGKSLLFHILLCSKNCEL